MKKFLITVCITLSLIALLLSFSSCQLPDKSSESGISSDESANDKKPDVKTQDDILLEMNELDRADELSRLSDVAMSELLSYKTTMTSKMQTIIQGIIVVGETKGETIYLFGDTDEFVYQEKVESTTKYEGEKIVATSVEGYQNGYMYIYNKSDNTTTTFKSPITKEQYLQHMKDMSVETEFELNREGCKDIMSQRNEDGTWTITYAKFTEEKLDLLLSELNIDTMFDESYLITDVKIVINIMSDFTIKSATMEFEFTKNKDITDSATPLSATDDAEEKNELYIEVSYDYNELEVMEEIDLSSIRYKEVEDLRCFYSIQKELDELKNSEEAKVNIEIKSDVDDGEKVIITEETDEITFKNKDGKLEYEIDSTLNGSSYKILYANGYRDVIDESGALQHKKISEMEARAYLESIIDVAEYKISIIRNIQKLSDGEYVFTLKPSNSLSKAILNAYGGHAEESTATLTIKLLDGKIVYYHYTFYAKISFHTKIDQSVVCTYEY